MEIRSRTVVQSSGRYEVYVGRGILGQTGEIVARVSRASTIVIVTTASIRERFGVVLAAALPAAHWIEIPDGEPAKTMATVESILTRMIEIGARRDTVVLALGGGVVGDTAGFAASIYLRGVDLIQVPTTLLAQVDSSVGGKVAVNHPLAKNLIGSFYPPRAVIGDVETLRHLPRREVLSGLYEAQKAGVIGDELLFERIEAGTAKIEPLDLDWAELVLHGALAVKIDIVSSDERESGDRRLLNYGHTIGHGIEAAQNYEGISHGEAVAWGMIAANAIARRRGLLAQSFETRINDAILAYGPSRPQKLERDTVLEAVDHDKKFTDTKRVMVLPKRVAECVIVDDISVDEIRYAIESVTS